MGVEFAADPVDGVHDRVGDLPTRKGRLHLADETLPECVADARVEFAVAENGKPLCRRSDEDHRRVALAGRMEPGALELIAGAGERVNLRIGDDSHDDVPRRARLSGADRALDARVREAVHGKVTCGALCADESASKYGFSLKREPKSPAIKTVGAVSRRVLNARASSL